MTSAATTLSWAEYQAQEHARIERLFIQLVDAFRADAREDTQALWKELEDAATAHFGIEERHALPVYRRDDEAEARALRAQHDQLRRGLEELGVAVQLHCLRDEVAERFIAALREHARREDAVLDRWLAQQGFVSPPMARQAHA